MNFVGSNMPKTGKHARKSYKERLKGLRIHWVVFLSVNAGLTALNLLRNPEKLWFYWPLLGWGMGIVLHSAIFYRRRKEP